MAWRPSDIGDLGGRVAVVTGATSGLGTVTARELARHGAHVVLTARDERRGDVALDRLRAAVPGAPLEVRALDLASLRSVEDFADGMAADHARLDILVNNAGVMATPFRRTEDGFELQIATNHLGPFALTGRLLPLLAAAPAARVVTVASLAHTWGSIDLRDLTYEHRRYVRWPGSRPSAWSWPSRSTRAPGGEPSPSSGRPPTPTCPAGPTSVPAARARHGARPGSSGAPPPPGTSPWPRPCGTSAST
jgi:nucleoside-diphosphate-sugar epimerase